MFIVFSYIKFLLRSTNQHGVHSPFVYDLVTKCFYDYGKYQQYDLISRFREELKQDKRKIKMTDLGAGSRVFRSDERKIATVVSKVGTTPKRARLLNRLMRYLQVRNALELGTSLGIGTAAMAAGNSAQILTVEGCPETAKIAKEKFEKSGFEQITVRIGNFSSVLEDVVDKEDKKKQKADEENQEPKNSFDLIFFDGNHEKEATLDYFHRLLPTADNDSVFIFDDIHWSKEMEAAWEEIKGHPSVRVTIDTFSWGFVFFRKEQAKEHFSVRI